MIDSKEKQKWIQYDLKHTHTHAQKSQWTIKIFEVENNVLLECKDMWKFTEFNLINILKGLDALNDCEWQHRYAINSMEFCCNENDKENPFWAMKNN